MNFGSHKFEIKKYVRSDRPATGLAAHLSCFLLNFSALFAFFRG